jgi:hypothetical protein
MLASEKMAAVGDRVPGEIRDFRDMFQPYARENARNLTRLWLEHLPEVPDLPGAMEPLPQPMWPTPQRQ